MYFRKYKQWCYYLFKSRKREWYEGEEPFIIFTNDGRSAIAAFAGREPGGTEGGAMKCWKEWAAGLLFILFLSFFCSGVLQMISQERKASALGQFTVESDKFCAFHMERTLEKQLRELEKISGCPYENLLAAVMLDYDFLPPGKIRKAEILADMLGYERLNPSAFSNLCNVYGKIGSCCRFFPVAQMISKEDGEYRSDPETLAKQAHRGSREEHYRLLFSFEKKWEGLLPVVNVQTGRVLNWQEHEVLIEQEQGIRIGYQNLYQTWKHYEEGETISAGELIGTAGSLEAEGNPSAAGFWLLFQLQTEKKQWIFFQGAPAFFSENLQTRKVIEE